MVKDFLKEGSIYAIASIASKGISLLLIPVFTFYFSARDFGRIEILYILSLFAAGIFSWQISQSLLRYIGEHQNDNIRKKYLSSTALFFVLVSFAFGTTLCIIFGTQILELFNLQDSISHKTFSLAMLAVFLNGIFAFFGSHLQALRKKKQYALSNFLHSFLGILATYVLVIHLDKSINGIFYATLLTAPVTLVYQFTALRSEYQWLFSQSILKQLLAYSLPLLPAAMALIILSISDRIMLNLMTNINTLGIYSVALKFAFGLSIIINGFAMAINPLTFQNYQEQNTKNQISEMLSAYIKLGATVVIILSLFSREIVTILTQAQYFKAQLVMPMLFVAVWVNGITMFAMGLHITKKTTHISLITLLTVGLNILLNLYLIPKFDIKGAALANLIAAALNTALLVYHSLKAFSLKIKFPDAVIVASTIILVIFVSTAAIGNIFAGVAWFIKVFFSVLLITVMVHYFVKNKSLIDKVKLQ